MRKKLILHIGPHKTGTTAIQETLVREAQGLLATEWHLELFPDFESGSHRIADLLHMDRIEEVKGALSAVNRRPSSVIISSENFARLGAEAIGFLRQQLESFDVSVIYFLRNPLERLFTMWKELVKHGYRHEFGSFLAARLLRPFTDHEINDAVRLAWWADHFGQETLILPLYDPIGDAARLFFDVALGIDLPDTGRMEKVNISQDSYRTEAMRVMTGQQMNIRLDPKFLHEFENLVDALKARSQGLYDLSISGTMSHVIFSNVERQIVSQFSAQIIPRVSGPTLFDKREVVWNIVDPSIWIECPDLYARMLRLRSEMIEVFGERKIDPRLLAV